MPSVCGYSWSSELDAIIREELARARIRLDIGYTFIAFESGFNALARNLNPPIEDSVGLLQLNRIGGQGVGYTVEQLQDPRLNLRVGLPPIARSYAAAWQPDRQPYEFLYLVATNSGHPGLIPRSDPRIRRAFNIWACFNAGWGVVPPLAEGEPIEIFGPGFLLAGSTAAALLFFGAPVLGGAVTVGGGAMMITVAQHVLKVKLRIKSPFVGPRTLLRRQLNALKPASLRHRAVASIDPRQRFAAAFRLPVHFSTTRLPPGHKKPRF